MQWLWTWYNSYQLQYEVRYTEWETSPWDQQNSLPTWYPWRKISLYTSEGSIWSQTDLHSWEKCHNWTGQSSCLEWNSSQNQHFRRILQFRLSWPYLLHKSKVITSSQRSSSHEVIDSTYYYPNISLIVLRQIYVNSLFIWYKKSIVHHIFRDVELNHLLLMATTEEEQKYILVASNTKLIT